MTKKNIAKIAFALEDRLTYNTIFLNVLFIFDFIKFEIILQNVLFCRLEFFIRSTNNLPL